MYNVLHFLPDDQWFNLTSHDMKTALVNAGMEYHEPQMISGTSLPNSTYPPSPAPMMSSSYFKQTPYDSTSITKLLNKTCPFTTSCDQLPHLDHPSISSELKDKSTVGSTEPESFLCYEDPFQLNSISVSSQATCNIEAGLLLNMRDNWITPTYHQQMFSLDTMTMKCSYCKGD